MFAFVSLVVGNLGLIFANRSRTLSIIKSLWIPNKALWWITGGTLFFLVLILAVPALRDVFQFAPLHGWEMGLLLIAGLSSILFAESVKFSAVQKWINGKPQLSTLGSETAKTSKR